ncbi:hypothetical protein P376_3644 [Streptomyces sp. HCCB10043]|nr:hypothetical protein P376_3644 [Streptomyces sp. HCCB10043]
MSGTRPVGGSRHRRGVAPSPTPEGDVLRAAGPLAGARRWSGEEPRRDPHPGRVLALRARLTGHSLRAGRPEPAPHTKETLGAHGCPKVLE